VRGSASVGRAGLGVVALLALLLGVSTARELSIGSEALLDADAAAARGDVATAIARARDAAEAAAPGSPYPRQGYARLEALARAAEAKKDEQGAIAAWGAMRAAATATSASFVGAEAWRALADGGLLRVGAAVRRDGATEGDAAGEVRPTEDTLRTALAREDAPPVGLLALLALGAAAFFSGVGRLAYAAESIPSLRRERVALLVTAVGALLYAVACFRA
jgi:hypothetical protein